MIAETHNLTPHSIVYIHDDGETIIPPSPAGVARVASSESPVEGYGMPCVARRWGRVECPNFVEGEVAYGGKPTRLFLIVSSLVLDAAIREQHPLLRYMAAPDTGATAVRDADGKIKGVRRFVVAPSIPAPGAAQ